MIKSLPPPFQAASDVKPNLDGSISLIDAKGKALAQVPLTTAFELSPPPPQRSRWHRSAYGDCFSDGSGHGYGYGGSYGSGHGQGYGHGSKAP